MTDAFYNTINLEAKELDEAEQAALTQEQRILRFFIMRGRGSSAAPSGVCKDLFDDSIPLTSVRRAMTNLTSRGDLIKSSAMINGLYGKPEHLWTVSAKWDRAAAPLQGELL